MTTENTDFKFNPAEYPRTYRFSPGWKVLMLGGGGLMGAGSLLGIWCFAAGKATLPTITAFWMMMGIWSCLALLGFYSVIAAVRAKIVLTPTAIETCGAFWAKRMSRDDIAGYRTRNVQGYVALELQPKAVGGKLFKIPLYHRLDSMFDAWFAGIENYEVTDFNVAMEDMQKDASLGFTPDQRIKSVERARKVANALNNFSLACVCWAVFYPKPYVLVVTLVASLPWIAILVRWNYGRAFEIDGSEKTRRANLTNIVMLPPLVLMMRAIFDANLMSPAELIIPAVIGGILMTGVMALIAPEIRSKSGLVSISIFMMIYCASVLPIANRLLDKTEGEKFHPMVLDKRHTEGRKHDWYLTVDSWGSYKMGNEIEVSRNLYEETAIGQPVCLVLQDGRFGFKWYYIRKQC
jgi:hypothetical protein